MNKEEIINCDQKYFMKVFSGRYPLVVDRGEGVRVYDQKGKAYIDFLAGIGVNALGYNHPQLVSALKEQIEKVIHCSNFYYIEPQAYLEELLINNSCADQVFFANSGAEANEGAIKLARKYFKVKDENRYEIITTSKSFHGRTLATLAATGQSKYQEPFQPLPIGFKTVPFNDLKAAKEAISPQTAAIMVEPIQGEGGVNPATQNYLQGLRKICDEQGILLILDEIQCGMGRTGTLFAYEQYGIEADIFTLAKGLGGGVPIGALLAKNEVANAFQAGDHGSTFGGNHLATKAAYTTLKVILEDDMLKNVQEIGAYFKEELNNLVKKLKIVKGVRGMGLMLALELSEPIAKELVLTMFNKGFLLNAVTDTAIRFLPPLIIGKEEIDLLIEELTLVLK